MTTPARWTGRVLSALVIAFLLFDAAIKLLALPVVTQTMLDLGYPGTVALARGLGALTLACALLYAYPRTAVLGAILLTGLLGGAMASHLRSAVRCSRTSCSVPMSARWRGAACICASRACARWCRGARGGETVSDPPLARIAG